MSTVKHNPWFVGLDLCIYIYLNEYYDSSGIYMVYLGIL